MIDWLPNFNQSNIVIALRAALAAAAILYVLEIYDIKNGMGHLGFLAVVLSCFAKPSALRDCSGDCARIRPSGPSAIWYGRHVWPSTLRSRACGLRGRRGSGALTASDFGSELPWR